MSPPARHLSAVPDPPVEPCPEGVSEPSDAAELDVDGYPEHGYELSPQLRTTLDAIDVKFAGLTRAERQQLMRKARFARDGTIYWGPEQV